MSYPKSFDPNNTLKRTSTYLIGYIAETLPGGFIDGTGGKNTSAEKKSGTNLASPSRLVRKKGHRLSLPLHG